MSEILTGWKHTDAGRDHDLTALAAICSFAFREKVAHEQTDALGPSLYIFFGHSVRRNNLNSVGDYVFGT